MKLCQSFKEIQIGHSICRVPEEENKPSQEKKKLLQGKKKSEEKMKLSQKGRHPFPASFHNILLEILAIWSILIFALVSFTEKKYIAQSA